VFFYPVRAQWQQRADQSNAGNPPVLMAP